MGTKARWNTASSSSPVAPDVAAIVFSDLVPNDLPLGDSSTRNAGWVNCIVPLKYKTSPDSLRRVPSTNPFLRYFALKKVAVTLGRRLPSVTTRYSRFGGRLVHLTSALVMTSTNVTCSPSSSSSPSSSTVIPSLYLRG